MGKFLDDYREVLAYVNSSQSSFLTEKSEIWTSLLSERDTQITEDSLSNFLSGNSRQASGTGSGDNLNAGNDTEIIAYIE